MVAILLAAVLGAGLSTLLLAKFGLLIVILAMPLAGSAAGLAAALGLAGARERHLRQRNDGLLPMRRFSAAPCRIGAAPMTRSFTIAG